MQYRLLIYDDEKTWERMPESERGAIYQQYMEFTQGIIKSGHHKAGAPLQPTTTATTVRQKGGKVVTTDGPFVETKEQLGGYYLVDAKNLDEAIEIAKRIPSVRVGGAIEIRPVLVIPSQ